MGFWDDGRDAHEQVYSEDPDNKGSFGHELIAGAASFGAMKMFEDKQRREGKTVSHAFAKELLAGIAGGEADKLAETYGKNEWEKHEARKQAEQRATNMYEEHYERDQGASEYNPDRYERHEFDRNTNSQNYQTQGQW